MYRNKASISDYYQAFLKSIEDMVIKSSDEYILSTETSKIISDLIAKSGDSLFPIEFDTERKETMRHQKEMRTVPARMRESFYDHDDDKQFEYETIFVTIPILPNTSIDIIKGLGTSTFSMSWTPDDFKWTQDSVVLSIDIKGYGFKYDDQQTINKVNELKKQIHEWVGWVNSDIKQGIGMIEKDLPPFVDGRKKKLDEDKNKLGDLSSKMGIALE
ncbi:MAG: hypothetical protein WC536_05000 [Patescibacteria group bacterium]